MKSVKELVDEAIRDWNELGGGDPIGTRTHRIQIKAFIIGRISHVTNMTEFIDQELKD